MLPSQGFNTISRIYTQTPTVVIVEVHIHRGKPQRLAKE